MAKDEAAMHAVEQEMIKAKEGVDKQIDDQEKQIDVQCKSAKAKIQQLDGKANAKKRLDHLQKAIKFCKTAKGVMNQERQTDYAALAKAEAKMIKENGLEAIAASMKGTWMTTTSKASASVDADPPAPAVPKMASKPTLETSPRVDKAVSKIKSLTTGMVGKATVMCQNMQSKVKKMETAGAFKDHPAAKADLLKQATAFCSKTRSVVKKEMAMDRAMLTKAKQLADQQHPAAVKSSVAPADAKKRFIERAKKVKAMEEKNFRDEQASAAKAVAVSKTIVPKKITKSMHAKDKKWIASDKHCQTIMKNLKQLSKHLVAINMVLRQFQAMEAEATLLAMGSGPAH
jgi:hypothetical protein